MKAPPITRRDKNGRWRRGGKFSPAPRGKYFDGKRWRDASNGHRFASPPLRYKKKPKKRKLPRRQLSTTTDALRRIKRILTQESETAWRQKRQKPITDSNGKPMFRIVVDYTPHEPVDHWQVAAAFDKMAEDRVLQSKFRSARILPQISYYDPEDRVRDDCSLSNAVSWLAAMGQAYGQLQEMAQRYVTNRLDNGERPSSIEKVTFWIE